MRFPCALQRLYNGFWLARSVGTPFGTLELTASSREQALMLMREEIRRRVQWCPCSHLPHDFVQLDVREAHASAYRGMVY